MKRLFDMVTGACARLVLLLSLIFEAFAVQVKLYVGYLQRQSFWFDIQILWMTFVKVLRRDGVSH